MNTSRRRVLWAYVVMVAAILIWPPMDFVDLRGELQPQFNGPTWVLTDESRLQLRADLLALYLAGATLLFGAAFVAMGGNKKPAGG